MFMRVNICTIKYCTELISCNSDDFNYFSEFNQVKTKSI